MAKRALTRTVGRATPASLGQRHLRGSYGARALRLCCSVGGCRGHHPSTCNARSVHMEMDPGWIVLRFLRIQALLQWNDPHARRQGALQNGRAAKGKFFFWLALHGRTWTSERRHRHGLQASDSCAFCDQVPEAVDHLLLHCPFSREVWHYCLLPLGLQSLMPPADNDLASWWLCPRACSYHLSPRRALTCWYC